MGSGQGPKQYRQLDGVSLLWHTIRCFVNCSSIDLVQVVIHPDDEDLYFASVKEHEKLLSPVTGGATRQASCRAGILALSDDVEKVLIHDAARPFVTQKLIENVLNGIMDGRCSLPANAISDTIKRALESGLVTETVSRDDLFLAQTPQGFLLKDIKPAHDRAFKESEKEFTDDAAVAEWSGMEVFLVEGDRNNFKITTKQDLDVAEKQVRSMSKFADIRTGNGYDVHALGPGDFVTLCIILLTRVHR